MAPLSTQVPPECESTLLEVDSKAVAKASDSGTSVPQVPENVMPHYKSGVRHPIGASAHGKERNTVAGHDSKGQKGHDSKKHHSGHEKEEHDTSPSLESQEDPTTSVPSGTQSGSEGSCSPNRYPDSDGDEKSSIDENQMLQGVVKWYDATKGYGYIMHPVQGDVYIHVSTLEAHGLSYVSTGMLLSFMMRNNNKGKEAYNVQLVGEQPRVRGKVKSYNSDRGFGWLATKDSLVDVFVHINELRRYNVEHLRVGMILEFCISHNAKGPTAVLVDIIEDNCERSPGVPPAMTPPIRPSPKLPPEALPQLPATDSAPSTPPTPAKNNRGEPESPAFSNQTPGLQPSPILSPRRASSSHGSASGDISSEVERSPAVKPTPAPMASRAVAPGKRFRGTVVWYSPLKGFGFLETGHAPDSKIYVHIYALEKYGVTVLELGSVLEFSVRQNHKGKFACNVVPLGNFKASCIKMLEGRRTGRLKSYDSSRMFGWIEHGDKEVFMNIYELRQDDAELYLTPGTLMEFSIGEHGRGPTAYDIDIVSLQDWHGPHRDVAIPPATGTMGYPHPYAYPTMHPPHPHYLPPMPHHSPPPPHSYHHLHLPHPRHSAHDAPPTTILSQMQEMGSRKLSDDLTQSFGEPTPGPSPMISYASGPASPALSPLNPHFPVHPNPPLDCRSPPFPPLSSPPLAGPLAASDEMGVPAPSPQLQSADSSMKKVAPISPALLSTLSPNAEPFVPQGLGHPPLPPDMRPLPMSAHAHRQHMQYMREYGPFHPPPPPHFHYYYPQMMHRPMAFEGMHNPRPGHPGPLHPEQEEGHAPHPAYGMPPRCKGTIQWCDKDGGYMTVKSAFGDPVDVYVPASEVKKSLLVGLQLECSLLVIHARVEARDVVVCKEEQALVQSLEKFRITLGPTEADGDKDHDAGPTCDWSSLLDSLSHAQESDQPFAEDTGSQPSSPLASILDELVIQSQPRPSLSRSSSEADFFQGKGSDMEFQFAVTVGSGEL